jgi:hypothetical protein
MLQIFVTILVVLIIFGGFFAITFNRKEGRELKKSCGCSVPGMENSEDSGCGNGCRS